MFERDVVAKALREMVSPPQGPRLASLIVKGDAKNRRKAFATLSHLDAFKAHVITSTAPSDVFDRVMALARLHDFPEAAHVVSQIAEVDRTIMPLAKIIDVMNGDGRVSFAVVAPSLAIYQGETFRSTLLLHIADGRFGGR